MSDPTDDPTTAPPRSTVDVVPHPETTTVLHLTGPLDRGSAPEVRSEIASAIAEGHPNLILDVRDVPTMDGAGANSLRYGKHRAEDAGGDLRIVGPTDQVTQRLELAGLAEEVPSHATVVEALEAEAVAEADTATTWLERYLAGTNLES
jgi:anti-sigma B factor antagonist